MAPKSSLLSPHCSIKAAKLLALMALFFSIANSSRSVREYQEIQDRDLWVPKGFDSLESEEKGLVEVSKREVPTGPDPLHHKRFKPIKP